MAIFIPINSQTGDIYEHLHDIHVRKIDGVLVFQGKMSSHSLEGGFQRRCNAHSSSVRIDSTSINIVKREINNLQ